ncbi:hypothetical protein [Sulfobacillus thermosulfidooxidans]|uniref:hypothetical protein n=1 Tax=Sulfobacillus thermosulfidooxidans TaxID=28034 RepID=UPI0003009081|nr:hypothetical protein [Sulfobacillus thermosulfidooxidans]
MNPPLLHVYPQATAHDPVQIVGTAAGLRLLAQALGGCPKLRGISLAHPFS